MLFHPHATCTEQNCAATEKKGRKKHEASTPSAAPVPKTYGSGPGRVRLQCSMHKCLQTLASTNFVLHLPHSMKNDRTTFLATATFRNNLTVNAVVRAHKLRRPAMVAAPPRALIVEPRQKIDSHLRLRTQFDHRPLGSESEPGNNGRPRYEAVHGYGEDGDG
jgi:hypothetical protein